MQEFHFDILVAEIILVEDVTNSFLFTRFIMQELYSWIN